MVWPVLANCLVWLELVEQVQEAKQKDCEGANRNACKFRQYGEWEQEMEWYHCPVREPVGLFQVDTDTVVRWVENHTHLTHLYIYSSFSQVPWSLFSKSNILNLLSPQNPIYGVYSSNPPIISMLQNNVKN